ncbi:MAG: helix-turn-helix domain-containing protein [Candidatus Magasanikbacteria bacterium]|jgi:sugar-specific transcriptional regulator TrmB
MDLSVHFEKLGFNKNKQKTYLSLLSLGQATAKQIAEHSGIERTTVYKIAEELLKEGLAEKIPGKINSYAITNPNKLVEIQNENKKTAELMLPELLGLLSSTTIKPKLKFYEGDEGVKKVFEDPFDMSRGSVVKSFSSAENIMSRFGSVYARHYTEERIHKKIKRLSLRPITDQPKSKNDWEVYTSEEMVLREIRFLPPQIKNNTLIQIYNNKIGVIGTKEENYAFILESKELCLLMDQVFDWIWEMAKR